MKLISKISVDSNISLTSDSCLCVWHCFIDMLNLIILPGHLRESCSHFILKMISAYFLWGTVLL